MKRRHFKKLQRPVLPVTFRLDWGGIITLGYDKVKNAVAITMCGAPYEAATIYIRSHEIPEFITALDTEAKLIKPRTIVV